jgi:hypothetical protein
MQLPMFYKTSTNEESLIKLDKAWQKEMRETPYFVETSIPKDGTVSFFK